MNKHIWLTSLGSSEDGVKKIMAQFKTYGIQSDGHFWEDDLEKLAGIKPRAELIDEKTAIWAILGTAEELSRPSLRYGLSMLAITVQAQKGAGFGIVILQSGGEPVTSESLTTPLKDADVLDIANPAIGAKLVAKLHAPVNKRESDFRMDAYANEAAGQWLEVGPSNSSWHGAMFGVSDGEISFHAVGPGGSLPDRSTLNFPQQGLKLNLGDREFTAWAVRNELTENDSYFVQIKGDPQAILFGPYPDQEEADVFIMELK